MALIPLKLFPEKTNIDFIKYKYFSIFISTILIAGTIFLVATKGFNFGIDFTGGIVIEARFEQAPDLQKMRESLGKENLGEVSLQNFGNENDVLIRLGQTSEDEKERLATVETVKKNIAENFTGNVEYRKVDYVGPKVGGELIRSGFIALLLTFAAIMVYIWVRFEWQYGVGVIAALIHDAILTIGFFSLTQLEFNLTSIAAILTVVGYSVNDSVVIYDRVRENFRKFKKMPLHELINLSTNETLARTLMTSMTTIISLIVLVIVGGEVIKSFSVATLFGILIGTYSSIYVGGIALIYTKLRPESAD